MANFSQKSIIDFVGQTTLGKSDPVGASNLISMLNASPALASQYQDMLNSGALTNIVSAPLNGAGAQANSSTGAITFSTNGSVNIDNMSTSSISDMGSMITVAAHEGAHLNFSTTNSSALSDSAFGTQVQNLAASGSGQDYTALIQGNQLYHSLDESNAMIAGWNAYIGYMAAVMPNATMWDLATNSGYSQFFMTTVPGGGYTLNPNLSFNSDRTLSPTPGNLQSEALNYYDNPTATLAGGVGYANTNADWELSRIIAANNGNSFSVNFQQLGLDPRQILIAANQPGDYPLPGSATITDSSSGTTYTYQNGASGTTLTSTRPIQYDDGSRTVDVNNYGANGSITSEIQTNYNSHNTSGLPDSVVTMTSGMAGTSNDTENYSNGVLTSETVVVVSSDKRSVTTSIDSNGDGRPDVISNVVYANDAHTALNSEVTATYNYDSGTVSVSQINYNPGGGQCTYDSKTETMSNGTTVSEVTGTQTAAGTVLSADVSGNGATVTANNATVTVDAGAVASIAGSGNDVSVGGGATATVSGSSDVVNVGSNSTVTVTGNANTVNIGGAGDHVTIDRNDATGNLTSVENITTQTDDQGNVSTTTTTTNYDPTTGAETGHSVGTNDGHGDTSTTTYDANGNLASYSWQTEDGSSGTNIYSPDGPNGPSGTLISETWQDGHGNSGTNTYQIWGALESSTWQDADGTSGSNSYWGDGTLASSTWASANGSGGTDNYQNGIVWSDTWKDANGNSGSDTYDTTGHVISDTWQSAAGTSGHDYYGSNGALQSDDWQSADGSHGTDSYGSDGSSVSITVSPGADGSTTTTTDIKQAPVSGWSDPGDAYGPNYGLTHGYDVDITSTTYAGGASTETTTNNQYGYDITETTVKAADGSYTTNTQSALGDHATDTYDAKTGDTSSSQTNADGSTSQDAYDRATGIETGSTTEASGAHSSYEDHYDANHKLLESTGTDVGADGSTTTTDSFLLGSTWYTDLTQADGTHDYSYRGADGQAVSLTADQFNVYYDDFTGAANDPGTGSVTATADPSTADGSTTASDVAVGVTDQQAA